MSIVNDDLLDDGLIAVMGEERCQDISNLFWKDVSVLLGCNHIPMDARWEPLTESWGKRVQAELKSIILPALLCAFIFWCQMTGKMDETPATCVMLACVFVSFFRVGRAVYSK